MIKELTDNYQEELSKTFNIDIEKDLLNNPFSHYLIYLDNNKILGYLNYYLIYDRVEIANFLVLKEHRNNGIGSKLLDYLINNIDYSNITLEVKETNDPAINLYLKKGFNKVAKREGYYNGIDGILMEKNK